MAEMKERVFLIENAFLSHLEADSIKGIELDTALEYDEGIASQLGSSIHKNRPADLLSPRVIITDMNCVTFTSKPDTMLRLDSVHTKGSLLAW